MVERIPKTTSNVAFVEISHTSTSKLAPDVSHFALKNLWIFELVATMQTVIRNVCDINLIVLRIVNFNCARAT